VRNKTYVCLIVLVITMVMVLALSGCSKKGTQTGDGSGVGTTYEVDAAGSVATNPPTTKKVPYDVEEEPEEKIPNRKKTLAKRKLNSENQREKDPDGDILSFMKKRCKKYGCSGSSSPNFYKVLQDTANEYGMTISQAQAAWNAG